MVIAVSYQTKKDAKDPHAQFTSIRYFECDQIPNRDAVVTKLKAMGTNFDENTLSINARDDTGIH